MNKILFPLKYKKSLLDEKKNSTIKISEDDGKYSKCKIQHAYSYAGKYWG